MDAFEIAQLSDMTGQPAGFSPLPGDALHDTVLEDLDPELRYSTHVAPTTAQLDEREPMNSNAASLAQWARAAAIRAVKTTAQALITLIGADLVSIVALDWPQMLGVAATMAVVSFLTSIAGIPEVDEGANVASIVRSN